MSFHVALPNAGTPEQLTELAVQAECLGFAGVWLAEHVLPPQPHPDPSYDSEYDPLALLCFLAAHTHSVRLGTSVLVLPLRNPFVTAKQAASVDALSAGRFELGIGVGWDAEEFASVGEKFRDRGKRTDEAVRLLRHLWSGTRGGFDGDHYSYRRGDFRPIRPDGIPITVGGFSAAAVERAVKLGDSWQSLYLDGQGTAPDEFSRLSSTIKARTAGRVSTTIKRYVRNSDQVDALVEEIPQWIKAGADDVVIWFGEIEVFASLQERFAHALEISA